MGSLHVDSATLEDLRARLGGLGHELTTLHIDIWQVWGRLGGATVAGELEHFCGTWHGATSRLAGEISTLGASLGEAAAAYRRIEQRLAAEGHRHAPTSGTGTTVIGGGPAPATMRHHPQPSGSGSGTTVIGGGPGPSSGSGTTVIGGGPGPSSGSGTTVIGGGAPPPPAHHHPRPNPSGSGTGTTVIG